MQGSKPADASPQQGVKDGEAIIARFEFLTRTGRATADVYYWQVYDEIETAAAALPAGTDRMDFIGFRRRRLLTYFRLLLDRTPEPR
jgi:hypothetical protein